MPNELTTPATVLDWAPLRTAFAALGTYDYGSSRASLMPIDTAVAHPHRAPADTQQLEERLLAVLRGAAPTPAKIYACDRIGRVGSPHSVEALAALLGEPPLTDAAQRALARLPGSEPLRALRGALGRLRGVARVGVIQVLGSNRDAASVGALDRLLGEGDPAVTSAAAAALGNIGSRRSAAVLRRLMASAPPGLKRTVADACLACAEQLHADGSDRAAGELRRAVEDAGR